METIEYAGEEALKELYRRAKGCIPPVDGFYVRRGSKWVKVYDLQTLVIEGYPVDDQDTYKKIGEFNGNLYPNVKVTVEGTATIGLYRYETKDYVSEIEVSDGTDTVTLENGGHYEVHAKGTAGVVTVLAGADTFGN